MLVITVVLALLIFHIVQTYASSDSFSSTGGFDLVSRLVENRVLYDGPVDKYPLPLDNILKVQNSGDLSTFWDDFFKGIDPDNGFINSGMYTLDYSDTTNLNLVLILSIIEISI